MRDVTSVSTESYLAEAYSVKNPRYFLLRHVLNLLTNNRKERTYFDSGDYALSAADRVTDNGAILTGKAHPHRDSISHPYAPIPAASNVKKDAIDDAYRKSTSPEESPLHQTQIEDAEPLNNEVQDNPVSQEGWNQINCAQIKLNQKLFWKGMEMPDVLMNFCYTVLAYRQFLC